MPKKPASGRSVRLHQAKTAAQGELVHTCLPLGTSFGAEDHAGRTGRGIGGQWLPLLPGSEYQQNV